MAKSLARVDPFVLVLLALVVAGIALPLPASVISALSWVSSAAVVLLFFLYGARLPTSEVLSGLRNWRVQAAVFAATFLVFPLLGVVTHPVLTPLLGAGFAAGFFFLTLLPSTVQSSVAFTSIAGGNVPAAVCAATVSNVAGMFLTPALVGLLMGRAATASVDITPVLSKLLLPFVAGQLLQPLIGRFVRRYSSVTKLTDRATILLIVAYAVASATRQGLWSSVSLGNLVALLAVSAALLAVMLGGTWWFSGAIHMPYGDRVVLLMCGSKKSLVSGLPIAAVIFEPAMMASVTIPVLIFHQLQLLTCAVIAGRLAHTHAS